MMIVKGVFRVSHQQRLLLKIAILSASVVILVYLGIWQTGYSYSFRNLLPRQLRVWPPKNDQQMGTMCDPLLQAARRILDGDEISLPFSGKKTLWPFKERVPKSPLWNNTKYKVMNESSEKTLKKLQYYNASARDSKVFRKIFITYGHNCCRQAKQRALDKARVTGDFNSFRAFDLSSISVKFQQTHSSILKSRRGAGYWMWKPYILLKTLIEDMAEGDLVMYQDAGSYLIRSAAPLFKACQESKYGIIVFQGNQIEDQYTKKDASILMDMNRSEAGQSMQRIASFVVVKKSCSSIQFVMEWLAYLSDRRIATDDGNTMGIPNSKSFKDHRHDQSVLSLLSKKWGIPAFRDPSQWGNSDIRKYYSSSPYEQLIVHDRFKN